MIKYHAMLQYVNGNVYELKGLDSAFHIHQPSSELVSFYGPEHYKKELFVELKNGDKMIFEEVPDAVLNGLEPEDAAIDTIYEQLINGNQRKRPTDATLIPVDIKELVDVMCEMQYHIIVTNGLWATDQPDRFKDHPAHHLLWQIWFKQNDGKATSYQQQGE